MLKIKNLFSRYPDSKNYILEDVNFELKPFEIAAIIGPSGVGKTTLFKAIVQNLINSKDSQVILNNVDLTKLKSKELKKQLKNIGFLSQSPNLVLDDFVYVNIKRSIDDYHNWFFKIFGIITLKQKKQIFDTLEYLGILDKAFWKASDLSGGQQQRVEIAKILIKKPKLILADEPTSALDVETSKNILKLIKDLSKNFQGCIILNVHDLSIAQNYADKIFGIKNNKIVQLETINKKLSQEQIDFIYK